MYDLPSTSSASPRCRVAVIWIDWYPYHVARFRGLNATPELTGGVEGIELVGGIGVHAGLKFREQLPDGLAVTTLLPECSWRDAPKAALARRLWRHLSQLDPDVVLVPGYYTLPALAAAQWTRAHGRTSVLMTESGARDHTRTAWKEHCKGLGLRYLFDWAIAGGKAHIAYLNDLGFPARRVVPGYDVVDNAFFCEGVARLRTERASSEPYFLYVGRFAEEKNVAGLLRSWLAYREQGGTWRLVLVGDGPEAALLHATAANSRFAGHVVFPGLRTSSELLPYYAAAGCFVLPSTREPWGLVVNEAMAAGLPVIASTRCGCVVDLLHPGDNGYVFDPGDPSADHVLTQQLFDVEGLSLAQRVQMGAHGQRVIQAFSPAHFGRSIASIVHSTGDPRAVTAFAGEAS